MDESEIAIMESGDLERLTRAIRSAVESVERRNPDCFRYNGVSLRGAVERRLYYEAVIDPTRLSVLCKASMPPTECSAWFQAGIAPTWIRDAVALSKAWARLMYYGLLRAATGRNQLASSQPEFVFCVLHPRFIGFFLPIIEQLGRHRCALLCEGGSTIVDEAIRHQLAICPQQYARLRATSIGRPPHALFPVYSVSIIQFLKALGTLQQCRPRAVVFAEAASFQEEVVARAARAQGIATVRVQHGRAGVISPGYYDMPYDKMLMWGEGFVERLKPTSPDCRYVVTGSPLLDKIPEAAFERSLAVFMERKATVTVVSQPECANISRQDYEALVFIVDHVLRSNEGTNILVRLHPADAAMDFHRLADQWPQRMRVTRAQDFALNAVLARTTVVVGLYSTVLSEAVAFGVVPVVLRLGERHRIFPSPEDAGAGALATNPDSAVAAICELVAEPLARARYRDQMEAFTRHYFGPMDGGAVARIAQHIENAEHIDVGRNDSSNAA